MHFNPFHQIMITTDGFIKWSFHLVNMIKLTPVSWEMTPVVINFSIKGGRCDSHANRAQWQGGHNNFNKLRQPNCRGGATGNHIIRLQGKHCSLKENNTGYIVCRGIISIFADLADFIVAMHLHIVMNFLKFIPN